MSARFDIHQHFGKLIGVPGSGGARATPEDDRDTRIAFLDQFGIGQCAVMPGHSYAAPGRSQWVERLDFHGDPPPQRAFTRARYRGPISGRGE